VLPMQQPTTYTGIRAYALGAFKSFRAEVDAVGLTNEPGMYISSQKNYETDFELR
jgi:hypothetical protein